jgi:hypothetical protein
MGGLSSKSMSTERMYPCTRSFSSRYLGFKYSSSGHIHQLVKSFCSSFASFLVSCEKSRIPLFTSVSQAVGVYVSLHMTLHRQLQGPCLGLLFGSSLLCVGPDENT